MEWAYWIWAVAVTVSAVAAGARITRLEKEVKELQHKGYHGGYVPEEANCLQGNPRHRATASDARPENR